MRLLSLTLLETTVTIEKNLKPEWNASLPMSPVWEATLAVAMAGEGMGSNPGHPKLMASTIGISTWSRAMPCLAVGGSDATFCLFLYRCYLKQNDALAENRSPSACMHHIVCRRRGDSFAGLSPHFLGSQTNFIPFDPLLPDRHLATLISGTDFFLSYCQHNAL